MEGDEYELYASGIRLLFPPYCTMGRCSFLVSSWLDCQIIEEKDCSVAAESVTRITITRKRTASLAVLCCLSYLNGALADLVNIMKIFTRQTAFLLPNPPNIYTFCELRF